jgi:hypothetical protein
LASLDRDGGAMACAALAAGAQGRDGRKRFHCRSLATILTTVRDGDWRGGVHELSIRNAGGAWRENCAHDRSVAFSALDVLLRKVGVKRFGPETHPDGHPGDHGFRSLFRPIQAVSRR